MNQLQKHMKWILIFFFLSVLPAALFGQCMTYPVNIQERVSGSQVIVEGKIISQASFWNTQQDFIYTSNVIEVYKVFKGNISLSQVEIITEGGQSGNQMVRAEPSLEFRMNDIGVFFGIATTQLNPGSGFPPALQFEGYASNQSFIRYDLQDVTASDPFTNYNDIVTGIYQHITSITGQVYTPVLPFTLPIPANSGPQGPAPAAFPTITSITTHLQRQELFPSSPLTEPISERDLSGEPGHWSSAMPITVAPDLFPLPPITLYPGRPHPYRHVFPHKPAAETSELPTI